MKIRLTFLWLLALLIFDSNISFSQESKPSKKEMKRELRIKNRIIPSYTHIIGIQATNNQFPLYLEGPSILFSQKFTKGYDFFNIVDGFNLDYQFSLPNDFFVQAGFRTITHYGGYNANKWIVYYGSYKNGYKIHRTYNFDLGAGYRIVVKNNFRIIDLQFGITIGANPRDDHFVMNEYSTYYNKNIEFGTLNYEATIKKGDKANFGVYFGLSKDIPITENLYVTAKYLYTLGKWSAVTKFDILYSLSNPEITNESLKGKTTAQGQTIALGLRWAFK